ncbi:MAG: hypothetical protein GEU74_15630 [Nitriliruptorales bacterium]|nr:hypothetical protein [Nitriliruptorales bacterium]
MIHHAARAVPWLLVAASGAVIVGAMLVVGHWPYTMWPLQGCAVGLLAGTAAWCFDEPAAAIADTAPRHLAWRTAARSLGLLALVATWTLAVLLSRGGLFGHALDVWLQGAAAVMAATAYVTWRRAAGHESPGRRASAVVVPFAAFWALARPASEVLPLLPYSEAAPWDDSRLLWVIVATVASATLSHSLGDAQW